MKIGISSDYYQNPNTGMIDYEKMGRHGYECVDYDGLCNTAGPLYQMDEEALQAAMTAEKQRANAAGIQVGQVHGPWPVDDTSAEKRAVNMEYFKRCVRATAYLDGKNLVVHPMMPYGWGAEDDKETALQINTDFLTELTAYAKPYGVTVCLENMPFKAHTLSPVPAIAAFVKKLDIDNLRICLDTGHSNLYPDNIGDMVRACGSYLQTLHVHDNHGESDEHQIPYLGNINWASFRQALKDVNYQGCMSFEVCFRCACPPDIMEDIQVTTAAIARKMTY